MLQHLPPRYDLNQSTLDWYSEVRRNTGQTGASGIRVYQCRVVRFSLTPDGLLGLVLRLTGPRPRAIDDGRDPLQSEALLALRGL
jgi:hypothetical protein